MRIMAQACVPQLCQFATFPGNLGGMTQPDMKYPTAVEERDHHLRHVLQCEVPVPPLAAPRHAASGKQGFLDHAQPRALFA